MKDTILRQSYITIEEPPVLCPLCARPGPGADPAVRLGPEPHLPPHAAVPRHDGLRDVHRPALANLLLIIKSCKLKQVKTKTWRTVIKYFSCSIMIC